MAQRQFHLRDILSITTDKMLSPIGMVGIYDILNFLTGDSIFTHQLPRALRECKPLVLEQLPQLTSVTAEEVTPENYEEWMASKVTEFGEYLTLNSVEEQVSHRHPIEEANEMFGKDKVITVVVPDHEKPHA